MDNTNNLSQSIFQSSDSFNSVGEQNNSSFFDSIKSISLTTWILIILILAFLGFNVFVYLAKGTQDITNFFTPIIEKIFGVSLATTSQAIDVSAEGAKGVVRGTANIAESGLTAVQDITPNATNSSIKYSSGTQVHYPQEDPLQTSTLNQSINNNRRQEQQPLYEADMATSSIQGGGKSGWCYIGQDKGIRSCAQVGVNDKCMSGEIFPSQEICMNPNLR